MAARYSKAEAKAFIKYIAPMIVKEGHERGYNIVSTTIAQALIEGGAGKSELARVYHNHFGLKCGSSWKGNYVNMKTKEEYTPGQLTNIKDLFRTYESDEEGVKGYYDFISYKRYANLKNAIDYRQFAEYLKKDGYATSSTYVNTLVNTVKSYSLITYDGNGEVIITRETLRKGDKNNEVRDLQMYLNKFGYSLTTDGIFGEKTRLAVVDFQKKHDLEPDGIVGRYTWNEILK